MKKIALTVLAVLALGITAVAGLAALQPDDYVISREITINAPAERVFPYLNSSKLADRWAPWKEEDPQAQMVYSGPDEGTGSRTSWDSAGQLGTGSATIIESVPNQRVTIRLEYTKPMSMIQTAHYLVTSNGGQSVVTWKVEGKNSFIGRVMCLFMDMDQMVGGMFEKGLSNLKSLVEKSS